MLWEQIIRRGKEDRILIKRGLGTLTMGIQEKRGLGVDIPMH